MGTAQKAPRRRKAPPKENPLQKLFADDVVMTSSELVSRLTGSGMSAANARQTLSRNSRKDDASIWRSTKLRLPRDERLFAPKRLFGSAKFFKAAAAKLSDANRHGMARCLFALAERRVLHKVHVLKLLAVSDEQSSGHRGRKRLYTTELAGLEEIGIRVLQRNTPLESIVGSGFQESDADEMANYATAEIRREVLLTRILVERMRCQNMCSWGLAELPDLDQMYTVFNGQVFSAFGFSYLAPLVRWKPEASKPTGCPVLIDVYQGLCALPRVEALIQRIERASHRGQKVLPSLGVIAAKDFSRDAWKAARKAGLLTVIFRQIFGDEALEAMVRVETLLHDLRSQNGTTEAEGEFCEFSELLSALKTNPVVTCLRSIGFEAIGGLVLRSTGYESVELGRMVPWRNTRRDVDVFGFSGDELRVVECKAYHRRKSLLVEDVSKFFTQTVPALKKWLRATGGREFTSCRAEIWTTGPLGNDARGELFRLKAPKGDDWKLIPRDKIKVMLPKQIKVRCVDLLDTIAMEQSVPDDAM